MDAREREDSQARRTSIKRPWEEDTNFSEPPRVWHRTTLPPIDAAPYRRPSLRGGEHESSSHNPYGPDLGWESAAKRTRYEGHIYDYNMLSRENLDLNGKLLKAQATHSIHSLHRSPLEAPPFLRRAPAPAPNEGGWGRQSGDQGEAADSLCRRCRRATTEREDIGVDESCEKCKNDPELAHVAQKAAIGLSQLAATLSSGVSSDQRAAIGIIGSSQQDEGDVGSAACPPIAKFGLRHTLNWILERICHVNELADKFVQNAPSRISPNIDRQYIGQGNVAHDGLMDIMKRRIDADSDDSVKSRDEVVEPISDAKLYTRRRSVTATMGSEDLPPTRSPHGYHRTSHSFEGPSRRTSIMNPPPAPNRQYPSPPGRSLSSPTYPSFPSLLSPSTGSYASGPPSVNLPPPSSLHQSTLNPYLPPMAHPSDALQAHSTALQHEVALQKIALASLQGEHDKLLQAFSRSQIRANTLEKEHSAADSEIISLTEEKLRLQSQVIELERSVKDLARSRDEFRHAAVQEGAQYVEIVKKASRLEKLAGEERKSWNKLKAEMEQRIEELSLGNDRTDGSILPDGQMSTAHDIDGLADPASSIEEGSGLKMEPSTESTAHSYGPQMDVNGELKEEIRRLRTRCAEVEDTLRTVRDESRNMEGIVEALGLARKSIAEQADKALGTGPDE